MGYDLRSAAGEFRWNAWGWETVLKLARNYGWKPEGTILPVIVWPDGTREEWSDWDSGYGGYFGNENQLVSESDSLAMADALERALPDIPDHDCKPKVRASHEEHATPLEAMSGPRKKYLEKFIAYCRAGAFSIA